jgi:hypothetical protein
MREGSYVHEEIDSTELKGTVAGNRLKKYHEREHHWQSVPRGLSEPAETGEPAEGSIEAISETRVVL